MKKFSALVILSATLLVSGCALWPSSWRLFGTPVDKEKAAAEKVEAARGNVASAEHRRTNV